MKIAFIRQMPYPYTTGGGTSHLRDLSRALIEKGHEVHIISTKPEFDNPKLLADERAIVHNVGMRHKKFSGNLLLLPFDALRRVFFEAAFMISSYRMTNKLNPDVVHCQTPVIESFPFALLGREFIITAHGMHTKGLRELYSKKKNPLSRIGIWFYSLLEKFNIKRAKKIICINPDIARHYEKESGRKCEVIGNGIFIQARRLGTKKKKTFFSLSRLSPQKGIDYIISALGILDKKGRKIEFVIAGDGDKEYVDMIKSKARGLRNIKLRFIGEVAGKKKEEILDKGAIFVMPSRFEPFGIALLEAMAHNCAVIASNTEGPKGIVKPSFGVLVDFSEEKKRASNLAAAIEKSLNWDIGKMGRAARKEVEKYDYKEIVKKYIKIYEDLARHGK